MASWRGRNRHCREAGMTVVATACNGAEVIDDVRRWRNRFPSAAKPSGCT